MKAEIQNIYRQVYNVREDDQLLGGLERVTCVFTRRALLAIGFNGAGELLTMHYAAYGKDRPVWELDFFEQLFHQEPLLVRQEKITRVFVLSGANMPVPGELYDQHEAEQWFRSVHFTEANDTIAHYNIAREGIQYLYSIPHGIGELIKISCRNAVVQPLAAAQFAARGSQVTSLQCFITAEQAAVVLHANNQLVWQRVFDYAAAEDIAYEVKLVCSANNISADKMVAAVSGTSATEYNVASNLSQYFSGITGADGSYIKSVWGLALALVKQLEACA